MTARRLIALLAASLVTAAPLHAAVLCAKKRGTLTVRDTTCRPKERRLDPAALGLVGPEGPIGPQGPAGDATTGTPHHQQLESPAGFLTDSTFTTGSRLTDVVFSRYNATGIARCSLVDGGGPIVNVAVEGTGQVALSFTTPIVVSGTLVGGCNGSSPAEVLLVGTIPAP